MKCLECSAEVPLGATFCPDCGSKIPDATTTATGTAAARRDVPEETLWEGSYSPKAMLGVFAGSAALSVVGLIAAVVLGGVWLLPVLAAIVLLWLLVGLVLVLRRLGISYKLTNHMFYHRKGVLTRVIDRIELIEIHDVTWQQSLFERLVGAGTIIITSADRTHPKLPLRGIENVEQVSQQIDTARRGEQLRRGRRIDFSNIDGQT